MSSGADPRFEPGAPLQRARAQLAAGRMVVLIDGGRPGDEGALVMAGEAARAEDVNLMTKEARGIICLALPRSRSEQLGMELMDPSGGLPFAISIEASEGITTGISAADRARTVRVASDPSSGAEDLRRPGHVLPVLADDRGVLVTPSRPEAAVELTRMAGREEAAMFCAVLRADGHAAVAADLHQLADRLRIPVLAIDQVVAACTRQAVPAERT